MLTRDTSALVIIDIQGQLADAVTDSADLFANSRRLAESAKHLDIPIIFTEQMPAKLGPTREELADLKHNVATIAKSSFGCGEDAAFMETLINSAKNQVVLCGIEAHICVLQTALQLLARGYQVYVAADAVSSRQAENKALALDRMRQNGAQIIATEMALFEWTRDSAHPAFREIRKLLA